MKAFTIRLDDDVAVELDTLAGMLGTSKNALINLLIRQEYSKYGEDPKVKKILDQANELKALLQKFQSQNK